MHKTLSTDILMFALSNFPARIIKAPADAHLFLCTGEFELQVGCLLLAVLEFLPRQLPLFFQSTLHLTQLPLCLQQFGMQLEKRRDDSKE